MGEEGVVRCREMQVRPLVQASQCCPACLSDVSCLGRLKQRTSFGEGGVGDDGHSLRCQVDAPERPRAMGSDKCLSGVW